MSEELLQNETMADLEEHFDDANPWNMVADYLENKTVLTVKIEGVVNGGVIAMVEGIRGFIPASQLSLSYVENLEDFLTKEIEVQVIEAVQADNRLILSAKDLLKAKAKAEKAALIASVEVGSVMTGTVETLQNYGAFIDLGNGLSGLVHVSQIANHHVEKPSDELTVGDEIEVKILDIEEDRQRIALSIRALQEPVEKPREEQVRDDSKFDRKPKKGQKARRERQPKQKLAFDNSSDIGTNLGDLIAAQLDLVDSSADEYVAVADEAVETEEFDTEYADYQEEAEVEEVEEVAEEPASIDDEVIVVEEAEEATEDEEEVDVAEEVEVEEATKEAEETTEDDDETTEA